MQLLKTRWWNVTKYIYSASVLEYNFDVLDLSISYFKLPLQFILEAKYFSLHNINLITLVSSYCVDYMLHRSQRNRLNTGSDSPTVQ